MPHSLLGAVGCGVLALSVIIGSKRKKARYLYAVAQFKRFHASAQWIAYDRKIFRDLPARYREELTRQCIAYGFGMLEVLPQDRIRCVIEPSRVDQFAGARSRLPGWLAAADLGPRLRSLAGKSFRIPISFRGGTGQRPPARFIERGGRTVAIVPARPGRPGLLERPDKAVWHVRWLARQIHRLLLPRAVRRRPGYFVLPKWYLPLLLVLAALIWWLGGGLAG